MRQRKQYRIPRYEDGVPFWKNQEQLGGAIGGAAGLTQMIGSGVEAATSKPGKVTGGEITGNALTGLGTGAAAGAMAGSVIPGIGTAVGAIGGAVVGLGSGLAKGFSKRSRVNRERRQHEAEAALDLAGAQTANMQDEYYEKHPLQTYAMEDGGFLPNLAYVDNNEILRGYDGTLEKVPNNKPGTDNHLIDSTNLESVLSDKQKLPGTNKTFAQEGAKLVRLQNKTKGKDRFARASQKLNEQYAQAKYEELLQLQESVKQSKGVKPKTKIVY